MSFCEDLKKIRQISVMSQEAFAKELGVSFTTVNRWETGRCKPSYKAIKLIGTFCKANGIDVDITKNLLEGEDNE
ncbi:helix-turn-helix protein [Fusobacterium naviforme]|uniref:DNA-binding transcriptional regulator YiaG n=1 Tax=Moryella indoligenes TaxID=371674 RepID=A0AAE3VCC5_9FIRM|nr:helix-turn-helix transcriptional regulator [Moryella indoligenes]KAB0575628.1 helix-turn-helix transcriptional regulator [Fusobacterium naviforme]MDQ0153453.1 DNA-binding transcriptional regulator YiaG [Moryella indoligenes]PSL08855.1 helix-turn-helix protein [Fusobacterium naviforme]STO26937.1 putative transcriptional regulator [Fusobacterium naviforme]